MRSVSARAVGPPVSPYDMKPMHQRDLEAMFRKATGHSTLCNCVRRVRGKLVVTRYKCDCENGKAAWVSKVFYE